MDWSVYVYLYFPFLIPVDNSVGVKCSGQPVFNKTVSRSVLDYFLKLVYLKIIFQNKPTQILTSFKISK